MEIKNKLTVTAGRGERVNRRKKGKGSQRTCIKDTWTKPRAGGIRGRMWGWLVGRSRRREMETTVLEQQ